MISRWVRLEKYLNYLLVFLLPTQLALHFWPPSSFVYGIRVDYLAPSIYLTDLLFLTLFVIWLRNSRNRFFEFVRKNKTYLFIFLLMAALNIYFSTSVEPSIYKWLKLAELGFFAYYVGVRRDIFQTKTLYSTLFYSLIFFSVIGILQFVFGRTLGGPLYLLGERSFNISTPGIALVQIAGSNFMRAYSTFSHPNSFAGFLGLGVLVLLFDNSRKELIRKGLGIFVICVAFILTFSLSAIVGALVCGILFLLIRNKLLLKRAVVYLPTAFLLVSLSFPFVSNTVLRGPIDFPQNIQTRLDLSNIAGTMISQKFMLGEGINTFIVNEPRIKYFGTHLWTLQPVHNIFLLIFAETGVVGLSIFYFLLTKLTQRSLLMRSPIFYLALAFVLTTGLFDHYWITLQQNMFLFAFIIGNYFRVEN